MNKKILVFGFKPYGKYKTNISEIIVNKIKNKKISKKIILPIAFDRNKVIKKIKGINPSIIIGTGQHTRARKIRIERKARNIIKVKKGKKLKFINKNSKKALFNNLNIKNINGTIKSYNAGTYVCNFTMFNIMDYIIKNNKDMEFGFLHIPKDFSIKDGVTTINSIINNLK